ncbi:MAG: HU family DNA-binding protein [Desulfobacterales bacterium]
MRMLLAKKLDILKKEEPMLSGLEIEEDGRISLPGFGAFSKVYRKARQGVNPATGEKITIEARHAIKFRPGKALKDAIS